MDCGAIPSPVSVGKLRLYWIIWMSLEPRFRHTCDDAQEANSLLYRTGSNILPLPCATFNPPSHTSTVQVSGRTPSNLGVELKADASTFEYERLGMPKRKNFNRRALSCTSTRTNLEGRRSVELMNLPFKPVRASHVQGLQGPYGGSQLALTLYRTYIFCINV